MEKIIKIWIMFMGVGCSFLLGAQSTFCCGYKYDLRITTDYTMPKYPLLKFVGPDSTEHFIQMYSEDDYVPVNRDSIDLELVSIDWGFMNNVYPVHVEWVPRRVSVDRDTIWYYKRGIFSDTLYEEVSGCRVMALVSIPPAMKDPYIHPNTQNLVVTNMPRGIAPADDETFPPKDYLGPYIVEIYNTHGDMLFQGHNEPWDGRIDGVIRYHQFIYVLIINEFSECGVFHVWPKL